MPGFNFHFSQTIALICHVAIVCRIGHMFVRSGAINPISDFGFIAPLLSKAGIAAPVVIVFARHTVGQAVKRKGLLQHACFWLLYRYKWQHVDID